MLQEIRPNILILALVGLIVIVAAFLFGMDASDAVMVYIGGLVGLAGRLLDPPSRGEHPGLGPDRDPRAREALVS